MEPILTPSQAARRYADEHGFKIVAVGRRYQATHETGVSFERGGYTALFNEMRAIIGCIENDNAHPVHGFAVDADAPVINEQSWVHKTADEIKADIIADVATLTQQSRDYNDLEYGTGTTLDAVAKRMGRDERAAGMSDREYRNLLIYGDKRGMADVDFPMPMLKIETLLTPGTKWEDAPIQQGVHVPLNEYAPNVATTDELDRKALREYCEADAKSFDDFCEASKARIRHHANRIRKLARKASGKPPGGPWHVIFDGSTVMKYGYPSRAEALDVVRWGLNHTNAHIRNNWRTATLNVEYRAS